MNPQQEERFEAELKRLKPAPVPPELVSRLMAARSRPSAAARVSRPIPFWRQFWGGGLPLGWRLAPAGFAVAVLALAALLAWPPRTSVPGKQALTASVTSNQPASQAENADVLDADHVEIEHNLLTAFDTVAEMPNGVPVRFNCQEWEDRVTFRDSRRGLMVERTVPRLEIVPVKYETY